MRSRLSRGIAASVALFLVFLGTTLPAMASTGGDGADIVFSGDNIS